MLCALQQPPLPTDRGPTPPAPLAGQAQSSSFQGIGTMCAAEAACRRRGLVPKAWVSGSAVQKVGSFQVPRGSRAPRRPGGEWPSPISCAPRRKLERPRTLGLWGPARLCSPLASVTCSVPVQQGLSKAGTRLCFWAARGTWLARGSEEEIWKQARGTVHRPKPSFILHLALPCPPTHLPKHPRPKRLPPLLLTHISIFIHPCPSVRPSIHLPIPAPALPPSLPIKDHFLCLPAHQACRV